MIRSRTDFRLTADYRKLPPGSTDSAGDRLVTCACGASGVRRNGLIVHVESVGSDGRRPSVVCPG